MSRPLVFCTRDIPEFGLAILREHVDLDVWPHDLPPSAEELRDKARRAEGLLTLLTDRIDADLMDACPKLRCISQYAVGYNNIDVAAATERGIAVGNTPDVLTDATADLAFALMMAAGRRLKEGQSDVAQGRWRTWEPKGLIGQDFLGKTLGVVGLGRIGLAFAKRCHGAFGMKVLYTGRADRPEASQVGASRCSFEEILEQSDVISVHTALSDTTREMFDAQAFDCMKTTSVFINTARGEIVRQDDLVAALQSGGIFAAGLDVTTPEPLAADHPLVDLPNCIVLPHIGSATVSSRDGMARIAAENMIAGLTGKTLSAAVNPEVQRRAT